MSKGQIVKASHLLRGDNDVMTTPLTITKDMLPAFRVVAYYHIGSEVVSDSIWVDVKDSCIREVCLLSIGQKVWIGSL